MSLLRLSRNALTIGAGLMASRLLAFAREVLLARTFGLSGTMDALVVALNTADVVVNLLLGGAAATVLLPALSLKRQSAGEAAYWALARSILRWMFVAAAGLTCLICLFAPLVVHATAPGLAVVWSRLAARLVRMVGLGIIFASGALTYTAILQSRERFAMPALASALQNATVVLVILALAKRLSAFLVAASVVAGAALRNLVLRQTARREGLAAPLVGQTTSTEVAAILADFLPATLAFSVVYFNGFIDRYFASRLGTGGISALNYADKLTQVPLAVLGSAVSIAIVPILIGHLREDRMDLVRRDLGWSLACTLALSVLLALAIFFIRRPLLILLFGPGRLSSSDLAMATMALSWYAITIVPETGSMLLMRVFHVHRSVWIPALLALGALFLHAAIASILAPRWGIAGIGFALVSTSVAYLAAIGALAWPRIRPRRRQAASV